MQLALEDRLADRLGRMLGMQHGADELALAKSDRRQLSAKLVRSLEERGLLAPADVQRVVPRRTWIRRKARKELTPAEFDGLYRLVRLQILAELVFDDAERARDWLHAPKARLGGKSPMDFARDSLGFEAVRSWLHEIDQGYFA